MEDRALVRGDLRRRGSFPLLLAALLALRGPAATFSAESSAEARGSPPAPAAPLWERVRLELPPPEFQILRDATVPSDTAPRTSLRRVELRFTSQVIEGKGMQHTAFLYLPSDPATYQAPGRKGKAVIVGQRLWDASMQVNYGDAIAARTGYPTLVLPNPGEIDGLDGEGRWMQILRDLVRDRKDPAFHNYLRLAVPYLRALDILEKVLGETELRAVVGGHSKRATSAFLAAAIDPVRIVGLVYMGNESRFAPTSSPWLEPITLIANQAWVRCPVLYLGATNEDGYEMFNIDRIQAALDRPWTIEYVPNYRHATASEVQFVDWQMWVEHVFDARPLTWISDLAREPTERGTRFRARVEGPNKIVQVKFWYVYSDDVPYWRDLVWYPLYPDPREGGSWETELDGKVPDAWFVEVRDTAGGFPGYVSSLPQDITNKQTKERVSRGWRSRHWDPAR